MVMVWFRQQFWYPLIILLILDKSWSEKVRYDNYTVFTVHPKNNEAIELLKQLETSGTGYSFWTPVKANGQSVDIMVPPHLKNDFETLMFAVRAEYEIKIENVQTEIDAQELRAIKNGTFGWDAYHSLDEIYDWLKVLPTDHLGKVILVKGGQTYESRIILGIRVSFSEKNRKNAVFLEANAHGRDWISNAVSTYIINQVLTNTDEDFRNLVESFDWYLLPVTNPDGYVYSQETDRLWRKTRQPQAYCWGADPNRNWDYRWNRGGAVANYCEETYPGPNAFSEVETTSISKYITSIAENIKVYISFHAYGQHILVPYGFTADHMDNYDVTYPIEVQAAQVLSKRFGTNYTVGNIVEMIDLASGNSIDWVKGRHNIPYVFDYELRDQGKYGYLLPPEQIIPTGEETLISLNVILTEVLKNPDGK